MNDVKYTPEIGDIVATTDAECEFYDKDTRARLSRLDVDGDWWGNFRGQGNQVGSFCDEIDGIWCIGRPDENFVKAD